MDVNLDSFRAMAEGKYNLGSVVVTTDSETHEQQLAKVDNHKYRKSLNVKPTSEENIKTRQVLSDLMKAHLQKLAGADLERDAGLRAELKQIDDILLGKDIRKPLKRSGALAGAFWAFDNFEARLLKTRAVTDRLRAANAAVGNGAANLDRGKVAEDLEKSWEEHPELAPQASRPLKAADSALKLRKEHQLIVDFFTKELTLDELGREFAACPAVSHALQKEVFGALRHLARQQDLYAEAQAALSEGKRKPMPTRNLSVKVFVDNRDIPTTTLDFTLKPDGRLELGLHGHRFELAHTAKDFDKFIVESRAVKPRDDAYFSAIDDESTRAHAECKDFFCAWRGNAKHVDEASGATKMFPPEDQNRFAAKLVEAIDKLRELNNAAPYVWGGAPHYGSQMPQLASVKYSRFGRRTWAHIRQYCNQQIEKGGIHALFGRALAKIQGVPLESGISCGITETQFEKATLFLNKVRLLALNLNWIFSQFENRPGETDRESIDRICDLVSGICQLQLHPEEKNTVHSKESLQIEIRTLIHATVNGYDVAVRNGDLARYFTALASGACFQGCTTFVAEYCDVAAGGMASEPVSRYSVQFQEAVATKLSERKAELTKQLDEVDREIAGLGQVDHESPEWKALDGRRSELKDLLKSLDMREIGTGSVFMKDGQVVVDLLAKKEIRKGGKPVAGANSPALEWSATPPFSGKLIPGMLRDIYRDLKFGSRKDLAAQFGQPPFHIPKVDKMVDLIVEELKPLAEAARRNGATQKRPQLEQQLAELTAEQKTVDELLALLSAGPTTASQSAEARKLREREQELKDQQTKIAAWLEKGRAARSRGDQATVAALMKQEEAVWYAQWTKPDRAHAPSAVEFANIQKQLAGQEDPQSKQDQLNDLIARLKTPLNGELVAKMGRVKQQVALLEKRKAAIAERMAETQVRIDHVDCFELNLGMLGDVDEYGDQVNQFIYLSADSFDSSDPAALGDFKQKLRQELNDCGYVYHKTSVDGLPDYAIGEEELQLGGSQRPMIRGNGFALSAWDKALHGSEFVRGVSETGEDIFRSSEGVEVVSPQMARNLHRPNIDGVDHRYEDGDMKYEYLISAD